MESTAELNRYDAVKRERDLWRAKFEELTKKVARDSATEGELSRGQVLSPGE
jgi:hypothetical protein